MPLTASAALVVDMEDRTSFTAANPTGSGSYYNGNDGSNTTNSDGWTSQGAFFNNNYNSDWGGFWSGWSYSNVIDPTTAGFGNQYAAFPGGGADGKGGVAAGQNYAVAFGSGAYFNLPTSPSLRSVELTNTTYAALSMQNGDAFAKPFGGATGDDADFFRVSLIGYDELDASGSAVGSVTVDLADFTFADNAQDYILDAWQEIDLTSLAGARSIGLSFASSDMGAFGINTPTFVALDNLTFASVPEPGSIVLWSALSLMALASVRRRVRSCRAVQQLA